MDYVYCCIVVAPIYCTMYKYKNTYDTQKFYTLYGQCMVKTNYEKSYRYVIKIHRNVIFSLS
jgi:hypothetical protein